MIMAESATNLPATEAPGTNDMELVSQARRGDMAAYDELVKRYQERIYATMYHMTSNHEDANDLAQESFIKAYQALNKAINFIKQRRNRVNMSLNDLDAQAENDPDLVALISHKTPRRDAGLTELQEKLNAAILKLSEQHRAVVVLHDIQGLPHEEIADAMGCNVGTVRSRLFYARQQLQGLLAEYLDTK